MLEVSDDNSPKREDLQIHDNSPIVLVEVKGIAHLPRDAAALQVWKYFAPRMKEWKRTDIRGLSVINHQKNLPPFQRENENPFRQDIITNAEQNDFGLLTTWDLFRLVRNFISNSWSHERVESIFYRNGRIDPIPDHYKEIGVVEHIWPKAEAVGVRVHTDALKLGDRIAAGILTPFIGEGLRRGMKVYRVDQVKPQDTVI